MAISTCPKPDDLKKLASAEVAPDALEPLLTHLQECDSCLGQVQTLAAKDTLIDLVGKAKTLAADPDDPALARMIERLTQLSATSAAKPAQVTFACSGCGKKIKAKVELAGKKVKCPGCGNVIPVPAEATPTASKSGIDLSNEKTILPDAPSAVPNRSEERTVPPQLQDTTGGLSASGSGRASSPASADATQGVQISEGAGELDFLLPPQQPDEIGRLGHYRILKKLGAGGMGMVFLAEDTLLHRNVAIKVMLPQFAASTSAKERFLREARSAASIEHEHIVPIFQVGEDNKVPFLAMPFLKGEPLDVRLERAGKLPLPEALRIAREMAEGLAAAHANNLIHRDIKPGNVWLEGKKAKVRLLDFGLARAQDDTTHLTQTGALVGTPAYMAPEQARGAKLDGRADLFSLGCVLYLMLTGQRPFKGNDTISLLMSLAVETPTLPTLMNPEVPDAVSELTMRLLAKEPADRPESAEKVVEELAALEAGDAPPSKPRRKVDDTEMLGRAEPRKGPVAAKRRAPVLLGAGVIAALLLALCGGGGFWLYQIVIVRDKAGNKIAEIPIPKGGKVEIVPGADPKDSPPSVIPVAKFIPGSIPPIELADFHAAKVDVPPELVAVLGENRGGHYTSARLNVAFSPDGKSAASVGHFFAPSSIILWDTATMRQRWKLDQNLPTWPLCAAFTRDGQQLVVGTNKGLFLLDANTGAEVSRQTSEDTINSVAVSPDGNQVLTGQVKGVVVLWERKSWKEIRRFEGLTHSVVSVAFSRDGLKLAATSHGGSGNLGGACVWDLAGGKAIFTLKDRAFFSAAFTSDGKRALFSGDHDKLSLCELATGKSLFDAPRDSGRGPAPLSPDGRRAARGFQSKDLKGNDHFGIILWNLETGQEIRRLLGHTRVVNALAFSPDGQRLLSASADQTVRLWDVESGKELLPRESGHTAPVTAVAFTPDGKTLVSGSWDHSARLWDMTGAAPVQRHVLDVFPLPVGSLALAPDSKKLAFCDGYRAVVGIWNLSGAAPKEWAKIVKPGKQFASVGWAPDGKTLVIGTGSGGPKPAAFLYDLSGQEPKFRGEVEGQSILFPPVFAPDGKTMGYVEFSGSAPYLADLTAPTPIKPTQLPFKGNLTSVAFTRDGKWLAGAGMDGYIHFWDMSKPGDGEIEEAKIRAFVSPKPIVAALAYTPDGKTLIWKSRDGYLILWDWANKTKLKERQLPGTDENFALSPDGTLLAAGTDKGAIYLLRLSGPTPTANPPLDDAWFKQVAAMPAAEQIKAVAAKLKERNPGFDGKVTHTVELGVVTKLTFIGDNVADISPLRALAGLQILSCQGKKRANVQVADLSPLKDLKLRELYCTNTAVSDLTPLKNMPLTKLDCAQTLVSDLRPLEGMKLTFLNLLHTKVSDLTPLKGMKLTDLEMRYAPVYDLAPLKGMPLTHLGCEDTKISDLAPLQGMELKQLSFNGTKVSDLSPLKGMPLKSINCNFQAERDAEILRSIKTLETINHKPAAQFWKEVDAKKTAK